MCTVWHVQQLDLELGKSACASCLVFHLEHCSDVWCCKHAVKWYVRCDHDCPLIIHNDRAPVRVGYVLVGFVWGRLLKGRQANLSPCPSTIKRVYDGILSESASVQDSSGYMTNLATLLCLVLSLIIKVGVIYPPSFSRLRIVLYLSVWHRAYRKWIHRTLPVTAFR